MSNIYFVVICYDITPIIAILCRFNNLSDKKLIIKNQFHGERWEACLLRRKIKANIERIRHQRLRLRCELRALSLARICLINEKNASSMNCLRAADVS